MILSTFELISLCLPLSKAFGPEGSLISPTEEDGVPRYPKCLRNSILNKRKIEI